MTRITRHGKCNAFGTSRPKRTTSARAAEPRTHVSSSSRSAASLYQVKHLILTSRNLDRLLLYGMLVASQPARSALRRNATCPGVHESQYFRSGANVLLRDLRHLLSLPASCALAAAIGIHSITASPAQAITTEQLLFLEAWRAVDRAYVDKSFNNQSWFKVLIILSIDLIQVRF